MIAGRTCSSEPTLTMASVRHSSCDVSAIVRLLDGMPIAKRTARSVRSLTDSASGPRQPSSPAR